VSGAGAERKTERVKIAKAGAERALKKVPQRERSVERHELPAQIPRQPP